MSLPGVIIKRYKTYSIQKMNSSSFVGGVYTEVLGAAANIDLTILPVGEKDIVASPDGSLTKMDIKIYRDEELDIPLKSIVTYKTKQYEIRERVSREDYGGYSLYIGKLKDD